MCGEKSVLSGHISGHQGSPPHVRGKVGFIVLVQTAIGITPACAGKSKAGCGIRSGPPDHPRMCGEKRRRVSAYNVGQGSPPHVRGKVLIRKKINGSRQDHPRMCGEKRACSCAEAAQPGSPPHVRGKEPELAGFLACARITPACAGKRKNRQTKNLEYWDHPRMCGEKTKKIP